MLCEWTQRYRESHTDIRAVIRESQADIFSPKLVISAGIVSGPRAHYEGIQVSSICLFTGERNAFVLFVSLYRDFPSFANGKWTVFLLCFSGFSTTQSFCNTIQHSHTHSHTNDTAIGSILGFSVSPFTPAICIR